MSEMDWHKLAEELHKQSQAAVKNYSNYDSREMRQATIIVAEVMARLAVAVEAAANG